MPMLEGQVARRCDRLVIGRLAMRRDARTGHGEGHGTMDVHMHHPPSR